MTVIKTKKRPSKTALRNKADDLFSKYIRSSRGKCERCGKTEYLNTAHIVSRSVIPLRYEEGNVFCLCAGCHMYFHREPLLFSEFVYEKKGKEIYHWLTGEALRVMPSIKAEFYLEVIERYKQKLVA